MHQKKYILRVVKEKYFLSWKGNTKYNNGVINYFIQINMSRIN